MRRERSASSWASALFGRRARPRDRAQTLETIDVGHMGDLRGVPLGRADRPSFATPARTESPAELRSACAGSIDRQLATLWAKDPYTARHSRQVDVAAGRIAEHVGLVAIDIEIIRIAAILHDVGKIGIPTSILTKPGPLTSEEFEVMKQHSVIGAAMLEPLDELACLHPLVLHHHEWYDGSGYPLGLRDEEIPFGARIIQAADCIDAMISPRSYKRGYSIGKVISELEQGSGIQFDPSVAAAATRWLRHHPDQAVSPR